MLSQGTKFRNLNSQAWFGDAFDIRVGVRDIPADRLTDVFKARVSQAADLYDQLADTTVQKADVLREIAADIEERMQAQAELERQLKEEGELCLVG